MKIWENNVCKEKSEWMNEFAVLPLYIKLIRNITLINFWNTRRRTGVLRPANIGVRGHYGQGRRTPNRPRTFIFHLIARPLSQKLIQKYSWLKQAWFSQKYFWLSLWLKINDQRRRWSNYERKLVELRNESMSSESCDVSSKST